MDFAQLVIHSFHNAQGNHIDDTTTAGNHQVFLPVQDGNKAQCRKLDVRFVCVQCTLNFGSLVTAHPYPVTPILWVYYYIESPQGSRTMADGRGASYTLVSFWGVNDLRSLNPDNVKADILTPVLQNGPVLLQASDFNLQTVNTNSQEIAVEIDGEIVKLAWHQVCASILTSSAPTT